MLMIFGAVAELEREYILQRQREGKTIGHLRWVFWRTSGTVLAKKCGVSFTTALFLLDNNPNSDYDSLVRIRTKERIMARNNPEGLKRLRKVNQTESELYRNAAAWLGISDSTFWILYALSDDDGFYTQQSLCSEWSLVKQTVNSAISGMVSKGLVSLEAMEGSKKSKQICLTEAGWEFCEKYILSFKAAENDSFLQLSESEQEQYVQLSEKKIGTLKKRFREITGETENHEQTRALRKL